MTPNRMSVLPGLLRLRSRAASRRASAAGVQIVPVQERVEAERVRALRLPAPERTDREHDDVTLAERMIDRRGGARHRLTSRERAREQQIVGVRRELQHDTRTGLVDGDAELLRE